MLDNDQVRRVPATQLITYLFEFRTQDSEYLKLVKKVLSWCGYHLWHRQIDTT